MNIYFCVHCAFRGRERQKWYCNYHKIDLREYHSPFGCMQTRNDFVRPIEDEFRGLTYD